MKYFCLRIQQIEEFESFDCMLVLFAFIFLT